MEFSPIYPVVPTSEYLEPPPSCHPILSDGYEIRPSLVAMVHAQSFSGRKDECPYAHLQVVAKMASHAIFQYNVLAIDDTHNTWTKMCVKMIIIRLTGPKDEKIQNPEEIRSKGPRQR